MVFIAVPFVYGACIWANPPRPLKIAHVWKREALGFSLPLPPFKKTTPGSLTHEAFHKSFPVLFGSALCLHLATPAHVRMYLNVALMA